MMRRLGRSVLCQALPCHHVARRGSLLHTTGCRFFAASPLLRRGNTGGLATTLEELTRSVDDWGKVQSVPNAERFAVVEAKVRPDRQLAVFREWSRQHAFSQFVKEKRDFFSTLYSSNFEAVQASVKEGRGVLMVDVTEDLASPLHTFFEEVLVSNRIAALDHDGGDADRCTAALSLHGLVASTLRNELRRVLERTEPVIDAIKVGDAEETVAEHFKGRHVGPIVERFPALKYLALKPVLGGAGSPTFNKLLQDAPGVRAHCERLVGYGEGVLRWLVREVPATEAGVGLDFKHILTRDHQTVTGLRRAYSAALEEKLKLLRDKLFRRPVNKVDSPLYAIISLPRMGKSLVLQDIARLLEARGCVTATVTYTSYSVIDSSETGSISGATSAFYKRLFLSCVFPAAAPHRENTSAINLPDMDYKTFSSVMSELNLRVPSVICVDEFTVILDRLEAATLNGEKRFTEDDVKTFVSSVTKLCDTTRLIFSGFHTAHNDMVRAASGRAVEPHFLEPPALTAEAYQEFRVRISPLRGRLVNDLPLHYLACQSVPGLLGHMLEALSHQGKKAEGLLPGPFLNTLMRQRGKGPAQASLRELMCLELSGQPADPNDFIGAQQAVLAHVVARERVVAHPLALVVILGPRGKKLKPGDSTPAARQVALLRHGLTQLHRTALKIHRVETQLLKRSDAEASAQRVPGTSTDAKKENDKNTSLDVALRRAKGTFLQKATYTARALLAVERARLQGTSAHVDGKVHAPLYGPRSTPVHRRVAKKRASEVGKRLGQLSKKGVRHFAWHLTAKGNAVADVLEGVLESEGWALTLTGTKFDGAAEHLESKVMTFQKSLAAVPAPFGDGVRVKSVRLVFLLPGASVDGSVPGKLKVWGAGLMANGCAVDVELKTSPDEVGGHISTPLAAMIPSALFQSR